MTQKLDSSTRKRFHQYVETLTPLIFANSPIDWQTKEKLSYDETFDVVRRAAMQLALEPEAVSNIAGLENFWLVEFLEGQKEEERPRSNIDSDSDGDGKVKLSCPFCDSKSELASLYGEHVRSVEDKKFWINCRNEDCSFSGPYADSEEDAISVWKTLRRKLSPT